MSQPENDLREATESTELREQCNDLRRQFNLLFGGLIVASFTLTAYLGLQARRAAQEYAIKRPIADQMIKTLTDDNATAQDILAKLNEFARTHPDFRKYLPATNAPAAAPKK